MDINILIYLTSLAVVFFFIAILIGGWMRLGLGWLSGGLLIIIGMAIGSGSGITSTVLFDTTESATVELGLGISNENFMIVYLLIGLLMIVYATFMDR